MGEHRAGSSRNSDLLLIPAAPFPVAKLITCQKKTNTGGRSGSTLPIKLCEEETMGQMFGINLASCCFTSNLDVTLGAFSKWFKFLHPLSAANGTLRVARMAKDSPGCGDIAHNNRNGDGKGGHNGSRATRAPPAQ